MLIQVAVYGRNDTLLLDVRDVWELTDGRLAGAVAGCQERRPVDLGGLFVVAGQRLSVFTVVKASSRSPSSSFLLHTTSIRTPHSSSTLYTSLTFRNIRFIRSIRSYQLCCIPTTVSQVHIDRPTDCLNRLCEGFD